jgi:hypothetical protein
MFYPVVEKILFLTGLMCIISGIFQFICNSISYLLLQKKLPLKDINTNIMIGNAISLIINIGLIVCGIGSIAIAVVRLH